ncbi:hypothetical protein B0H17DRAFT_1338733 [Mycena rosella]|uniref:DUF6532 domain-containing protein n=1 Tax=Mycena rosella TaxID=1033263 RepID=A0AAD7CJL8_MYCRO|nr:hypothetical protein B0H17DRAFT_1338733 [Mycena rosella]
MSTRKLTPAEKRKATLAAKAAKELEENIAFQNQSLKDGGRPAKREAKKNAIWKADQPNNWKADQHQATTRKRTSSTAEDAGPAKKARETAEPTVSDSEDGALPEVPVSSKGKATTRKYAAPDIAIDTTDESEPEEPVKKLAPKPLRHIDFTKLPAKGNSASVPKAKAPEATHPKSNASKTTDFKAAAAKPLKIIAESDSQEGTEESSVSSSSEDASDSQDEVANEREFLAEVVSTRSRAVNQASEDSESHELDDVAPRAFKVTAKISHPKLKRGVPQSLFDSESDEVVVLPKKKKSTGKAKAPVVTMESDSEDSMPDAPKIHRRKVDSDIDMPSGHPHRVLDEDVEFAEAMADSLVSVPMEPRSRRSSMTSNSSGHMSVPASEDVSASEPDIEDSEAARPKKKKKSKKVSAARQKQADAEKPEIKPTTALDSGKGKAPVKASTRPESSWDVSARLVLPAVNKDIGLTAQHPELQAVLRDTMSIIKIYMWFDDAYPLMASRPGFCRPHLITAAQARGAVHILERLLKDPAFGAILAPIPCDRMNLHRGNVKRCAVSCVLAFYKLADLAPDQVKTRIEELLKDHRYICSVDSEGRLELGKPFNHGSIRFVLKEEILSSASFVTQNIDRFPAKAATAHKPIRHEVADPMVAIAATAVYAALVEYRMTGQRQNIPFTEDAYEDTYRNHMSSLRDLRTRYANALHQRLHELFKDTTASNKVTHTASGSSATLVQLADVPDSD